MLDQDDRAALAKLLGAKPAEIIDAVETDAGAVVTTHDGTHTLIRPDRSILSPYRWEGAPPAAVDPAPVRAAAEVPPIPLPAVGEVYTAEHERALLAWLLDQGVAPAIEEPAAATPPVDQATGDEAEAGQGDGEQDGQDDVDEDTPPGGTVADVLAWVGDDKQRAAQALAAEQLAEKPRASLVAKLEALTADGGTA